MNRTFTILATTVAAALTSAPAFADEFGDGLAAIQREWAVANYQTTGKTARGNAFSVVVDHAAAFRAQHPDRAEALAWEGIVLSTYAGEVSAMSAMKYAKAARAALESAEKLDATALAGGIYASLGALYSKVPGGFIGFGDDEIAARYFSKALAVDPDNIDNNYFFGEFLLDQGDYARARAVLEHACPEAMVGLGAQQEDGGRVERGVRAQRGYHLFAVELGHHQVADDQIRQELACAGEPELAVLRAGHAVARLERAHEQRAHVRHPKSHGRMPCQMRARRLRLRFQIADGRIGKSMA